MRRDTLDETLPLKAFQIVGAYQPKPLDVSLIYVIEHLAPAVSTLRGLVVDAYHLPRLVLLHGQQDIERFRIYAALAVNLDMHAVLFIISPQC